MDLAEAGRVDEYPSLRAMGPEPLSTDFSAAALARACQGKRVAIKVALLDQRVVAGLGNIYASEALHLAGLLPTRASRTLATPLGMPRPDARQLVKSIKTVLANAIKRRESPYRSARFRVYEREGEACLRKGCAGIITRVWQAGRSTFYCPQCQR